MILSIPLSFKEWLFEKRKTTLIKKVCFTGGNSRYIFFEIETLSGIKKYQINICTSSINKRYKLSGVQLISYKVKRCAYLKLKIEQKRRALIDLAISKGFSAEEVITKSQQLDNLLNKYTFQKLTLCKQRMPV